MRNRIFWFFLLIICKLCAENNASDFMMSGLSARAMALGNSMTAMSGHCDTVFFNPAGLADNGVSKELSFAAVNNFDSVERKNIGFKFNDAVMDYGLNISNSLVADIPRSSWGDGERPVQESSFDSEQYNYTLTLSRKQDELFRYGINIKRYSHTIDRYTAQAIGFDAGVLYRCPQNIMDTNILLGAALHNICRTKVSWSTGHSDTMPFRCNLGISLYQSLFSKKIIISSEIEKKEDVALINRNGMEYWLVDSMCALRIGVDNGRLGYGIGLEFDEMTLDYAQADYEELGLARRISMLLKF